MLLQDLGLCRLRQPCGQGHGHAGGGRHDGPEAAEAHGPGGGPAVHRQGLRGHHWHRLGWVGPGGESGAENLAIFYYSKLFAIWLMIKKSCVHQNQGSIYFFLVLSPPTLSRGILIWRKKGSGYFNALALENSFQGGKI